MKTCFCFLTHIITEKLYNRIYVLSKTIKLADFYVIYDGTFNINLPNDVNIFFIDRSEINEKLTNNIGIDFTGNNCKKYCNLFLCEFYLHHNEYDYYYFMENDVSYFGNMNNIIGTYLNNDSDVLIQNDINYYQGNKYYNNFYELYDNNCGYGHHSIEYIFPNCIQEMRIFNKTANDYPYKRLFQFYRFSNRFIKKIIELTQKNEANGMFEWLYCAVILEFDYSYDFFKEPMYLIYGSQCNEHYIPGSFLHAKSNL